MVCDLQYFFPLATGAIDYIALNSDLTFSPGNKRVCSNVSIINDAVYEDPEDFTVSISTSDPSVIIDPTRESGTATILDDDGKLVKCMELSCTYIMWSVRVRD